MEIGAINSSTPIPASRPAAEVVPVMTSAQHAGQVTSNAVGKTLSAEKQHFRKEGDSPADSVASLGKVKEAVNSISESLASLSSGKDLQFSVEEDLGRVVVKVIDKTTDEVVKQIPSEDAIRLAKSLSDVTVSLHSEKA